jgi:hypothetical protein
MYTKVNVKSTAPEIFAIAIVAVSVWMKQQFVPRHRYLPCHQTPQWLHFLDVYDRRASRYFEECASKRVSTSFGETRIFACGSAPHLHLLFFHEQV